MLRRLDPFLLRGRRPSVISGVVTMVILLIVCTALVYPLAHVTRPASLGVVYLLGVLVIASIWGLWLGILTSLLSAAAFNFFHLPPVGRFTIANNSNWVALITFLVVAVIVSVISELARHRAEEAQQRRAEADLTADMAQLVLSHAGLEESLGLVGQRLAAVFGLRWAEVSLDETASEGGRRLAIPLLTRGQPAASLFVPADLPAATLGRLRRAAAPALAAILTSALERERLVAEAVQTEGLRRSEAVKTAVLRAVSHDLRSPVTAMIAAGAAIRAPDVSAAEREELGAAVQEEGSRLARLIDDLLDLSKLEAQAASPQLAECSIEEVIEAALALQPPGAPFEVRVDPDLPLVRADFVQLERALANLLENATRYAAGSATVVRARRQGDRVSVRVVDGGAGIAPAEQERIFEPFYRAESGTDRTAHAGSGLGLAVARGFVEVNGGRIWVESAPGQGSAFVIELPAVGPAGGQS